MADTMYVAPVIPGPTGARRPPRAGADERVVWPVNRTVLEIMHLDAAAARCRVAVARGRRV